MPRFIIKIPNDDEGEELGVYESDYLPRVGDPFALWHPRVCAKKDEPFLGIVSGVTHESVNKDHPYWVERVPDTNVVDTTVWLTEEHGAPTIYCDCSEEKRARFGVIDGTCGNCSKQRRS